MHVLSAAQGHLRTKRKEETETDRQTETGRDRRRVGNTEVNGARKDRTDKPTNQQTDR